MEGTNQQEFRRQKITEFVKGHDGNYPITRILIANNGNAAVKEIRSVRKWAYRQFGDDKIFTFIVMASPEDLSANAEFIRMADEYVMVPGGSNNMNYANVKLIIDMAQKVGAHAVWAGWGHASENPKLPDGLSKVGVKFIGPGPTAMRTLGDKISSMIVAQTAGVPCLPWSGSGLKVPTNDDGNDHISDIPESIYTLACVKNVQEGLAAAEKVGFPLMIKASEGGGGKGIRRVDQSEDFASNFDFVQREVPGSPIFLMKLASEARHLEVQLLGDEHGQAISIFGRDCSVQRRHQKIIEEAPVLAVKDQLQWQEMEKAAVRLAKLVGYVSTGTVEYLYDVANDRFSFLELNPRLQVEHPCTEMISKVNLPAAQLQVAMGIPLHRIADIRRLYGKREGDDSTIDFENDCQVKPLGHVIACRITAENPEAGFKPGGGRLTELNFRGSPDVWGYFSIPSSGIVHEYADSQFGHVFSLGKDRNEAVANMAMALKEISIRADFRNTVEFLIQLLETSEFKDCKQTTAWLDELIKKQFGIEKLPFMTVIPAGASWHAFKLFEERSSQIVSLLQKGQLPGPELLEKSVKVQFIYDKSQYVITISQVGPDRLVLTLNDTRLGVKVIRLPDGGLLMTYLNGKTLVLYGKEEPLGLRLSINGKTVLIENERDPTVIRSPSPGKLVRFLVSAGQMVSAGTPIAEIEVMKMYMPLLAAESGAIYPIKPPGSSIEAGEIVANVNLLDPSNVQKAILYDGGFTEASLPVAIGERLDDQFNECKRQLFNFICEGYIPESSNPKAILDRFLLNLTNPELPLHFLTSSLSNIVSRLPSEIEQKLNDLTNSGFQGEVKVLSVINDAIKILTEFASICDIRDVASVNAVVLMLEDHKKGPLSFADKTLSSICERILLNTKVFEGSSTGDAILCKMREMFNTEYSDYTRALFVHKMGENHHILCGHLFRAAIETFPPGLPKLIGYLRQISRLSEKCFSRLSQVAREAIMHANSPSIKEIKRIMESQFRSYEPFNHDSFVSNMVSSNSYHLDVLPMFFLHEDELVRRLSLEVYIRRVFEAFKFLESSNCQSGFTWVVAAPPPALKYEYISPATLPLDVYERRAGVFASFNSVEDFKNGFDDLICKLAPAESTKNVVYSALPDEGSSEEELIEQYAQFMQSKEALLSLHQIKRVTLVFVLPDSASTKIFTFRELLNWREDCQVRHMEPAMSYLLELPRILHHHSIKLLHADPTGQIHIYKADAPNVPGRLFIRVLVRPLQIMKGHSTLLNLTTDARAIFEQVLDAVQMVQSKSKKPFVCNHLYIYVLPIFNAEPKAAADMFLSLMGSSVEKLLNLRIMEGEIRMNLAKRKGETPERYRFYLWNETGFVNCVSIYREKRSSERDQPRLEGEGHLNGQVANASYPAISRLQVKRNRVHSLETSYVYDFPVIFKRSVELSWSRLNKTAPPDCLKYVELVLRNSNLEETIREPGLNDIGMVAWKMMIKTPYHPNGRYIIAIANDIDFEIGSFGVKEDSLFAAASALARKHKWPRVYLSANSGARIGLAEELRDHFEVQWVDPLEPSKGFEYLFLTPEKYSQVSSVVKVEWVEERGHYKVTDILSGLGVENLSGSAIIASETSKAYRDIFTLTFVTGRSVGIGAYLVRLGQRVIQKNVQPIILTGVAALNQVLGRDVYTSNLQIGGPQIMAANGVSHQVVNSDLDGIQAALAWLDFVEPCRETIPLSVIKPELCIDDPNRIVSFTPPSDTLYDPRFLATGVETGDGVFLSGLLDRGSFVEYQSAWARSVIVGRGRLGGFPVAVLMVETRTTQTVIPADPASPTSESITTNQAGQVWFPDSAFKTAQFIRDCNQGEKLPLIILANWRGFSGGQRDLYDEMLKFGSYIVDSLREYRQPVFVYLPPGGQLRGGSWVVLDTEINNRQIEMYADPTSRGGILEAEGMVAIKYRAAQLRSLQQRLLPSSSTPEQDLTTMHHVACTFADLHDRPGRMVELKVIKSILPWRDSRRILYHKLRVKLWQLSLVRRAAHLCRVHEEELYDNLHDELLLVLNNDWLPSLCIDPSTTSESDIADAMNKHCSALESKLMDWCMNRVIGQVDHLFQNILSSNDRIAVLTRLLSDEGTKSTSPNR